MASNGWNEFLNHPLTGMSRSAFISEYRIAPHFLPIDSAATAGVVGLVLSVGILGLLAAEVVRGPGDGGAWAQAGHLGVVVMAANTLTDAYGPFVGIARSTPLWIALVIASGYRHREDDPPAPDSTPIACPSPAARAIAPAASAAMAMPSSSTAARIAASPCCGITIASRLAANPIGSAFLSKSLPRRSQVLMVSGGAPSECAICVG